MGKKGKDTLKVWKNYNKASCYWKLPESMASIKLEKRITYIKLSRTDQGNRVTQNIPGTKEFNENIGTYINVGKGKGKRSGKSNLNLIQLKKQTMKHLSLKLQSR